MQDVENLQGDDRPTLAPDLYKHAIGVSGSPRTGAVFQYGPSCYYVLGEIMKRKLAAQETDAPGLPEAAHPGSDRCEGWRLGA